MTSPSSTLRVRMARQNDPGFYPFRRASGLIPQRVNSTRRKTALNIERSLAAIVIVGGLA